VKSDWYAACEGCYRGIDSEEHGYKAALLSKLARTRELVRKGTL